MNEVLVFGHRNPDTDTICSALAAEYIFKDELNVVACRLGELSDETKYVLDYVGIKEAKLIRNVENKDVILVDHNEFNQSAEAIEKANILKVIDHHRVSNFSTTGPLYMNLQPVGCTCTILYQIAQTNNVKLSKEIATIMLSAIISDTLLFKSPTCTPKDKEVAEELEKIAEVDINKYGLEMLKSGTDLSKFDAKHIINIDAKTFETENGKFKVSQVTTLDIDELMNQFRDEFKKEMEIQNDTSGLNLSIVLVTDILECNSLAVVIGDKTDFFNEQFSVNLVNNEAILKDVVSRKKQIVPYL